MKTLKLLAVILASCLGIVSEAAQAETVKRSLPACISEDLLDEFSKYMMKGDKAGYMQLMASGQCTLLRAGDAVSVIDAGFITTSVRYRGAKLHTPAEAVR